MSRPTPASASGPAPRHGWRVGALVAALALTTAGDARAAEVTEIVDDFDQTDALELNPSIGLNWQWRQRRGGIRREYPCIANETLGGESLCPEGSRVGLADELRVLRTSAVLNVDARLGLGRLLELRATLPVVLYDRNALDFAPGVSENNSLTDPYNQPSLFDVPFEARERSGLGDLQLALRVAPLSKARDRLDPDWVLGVSLDLPTASIRRADNSAPGDGVWRLGLSTAVSSRVVRWLEPFLELNGTIAIPGGASPYVDLGPTATLSSPAHRIGARFGLELVPFEKHETRSAVRLELGGRFDVVFDGRGFSDLADALGTSTCDPSDAEPCTLTTYDRGDVDPVTGLPKKTDGITRIEHHLVIGGWLGLRYEVFEALELRARASVFRESDHFLTFTDAGVDLDGVNDVQRENGSGVNELDPTWLSGVDEPGTRYRTGGLWTLGIDFAIRAKF
ncbi:MAG: hypothetical protein EP329_23030 [Deltaproteobacteria bacterium]|nr:MAG: hypothetical protein EP329_23030 [Deltaproteobacteria bacterium]